MTSYSHPLRLWILLLLCWLASGCAVVPNAPIEDDQKAKSFRVPPAGKSTLYLVRNTTWGQSFRLELSINGLPVALTAPHTYVKFDLPPGTYFIGSRGENYDQKPIDLGCVDNQASHMTAAVRATKEAKRSASLS
jgi:hypothetical protein